MNRVILFIILITGALLPFHNLIIKSIGSHHIVFWKEAFIIVAFYLACLGILKSRSKLKILSDKINMPIFIFIFFAAFSTVLHPNLLSLRGFLGYVLYCLIYIILITHINIKQVNLMLNILLFIGLILGLGALLQIFLSPEITHSTRLHFLPEEGIIRTGSLMGGSPIVLGGYLGLLFPIAFALCSVKTKKYVFIIYLGITVAILSGILLSFSRAAYFQLVISVLAIIFFSYKYKLNKSKLKQLISVILIFLIILMVGNSIFLNNFLNLKIFFNRFFSFLDFDTGTIDTVRVIRWKTTISFIFEDLNFILGGGPGVGWHFGTYDIKDVSPLYQKLSNSSAGDPSPESFFLLIMADLGIFGFITFFFIYWKFIFYGIWLIKYYRSKDLKLASICTGVTSALIGLFPSLCFSIILTSWPCIFLFWFFISIITTLYQHTHSQQFSLMAYKEKNLQHNRSVCL
ncbi:MAG: O-antigen ligase family protein [Candidatus Hodarchaeota archaeon]